ncbi:MAG TPA: cysteine--tRNA ligase, partial [bacterium]|nr:cysteine--tRNA ligase [bacterium]
DPLNFTERALFQAENTVKNYNGFYQALDFCKGERPNKSIKDAIEKARQGFTGGLDDDLNISLALSEIFNLMKQVNVSISEGSLSISDASDVKNFLEEIDSVLAILDDKKKIELTEEEKQLINEREKARKEKNFNKADEIRELLKKKGIILEDTPYGTRWKKA